MAKIIGVSTIHEEGFKDLHCSFCGYFMKVKVYPFISEKKLFQCKRCKARFYIEDTNRDRVSGNFKVSLCCSTVE